MWFFSTVKVIIMCGIFGNGRKKIRGKVNHFLPLSATDIVKYFLFYSFQCFILISKFFLSVTKAFFHVVIIAL